MSYRHFVLSAVVIWAAAAAFAQTAETRPTTAPSGSLGERFESKAAGIALRPPAGGHVVRGGPVEQVMTYVDEDRHWTMRVTRITLPKPALLSNQPNPNAAKDTPQAQPGLLETMAGQLVAAVPGTKLPRCDTISGGVDGKLEIGMLAARSPVGTQRVLRQQALVQAHDQLYYLLDLVTPSGIKTNDDEEEDDLERRAVEVFQEVVDSVQLLDLGAVVRDAESRLFATRTLYVNLTAKKVPAVLKGEQCYIMYHDAKPVGWSFVAEEIGQRDGQEGLVVALRSHSDVGGATSDSAAEMFCRLDRKYESWVAVAKSVARESTDAAGKVTKEKSDAVREVGMTNFETRRVFDRDANGNLIREKDAQGNPIKDPAARMVEQYTMTVNQFTPSSNPPAIERQLPPFYLPQALGYVLPRLLPLDKPKGYLFATWVSGQREVMRRYIDVETERQVNLGGKVVRAIPVRDRLGLEGPPTVHYLASDGQYLGSVNEEAKLTLLATTPDAVKAVWPGADLSAPRELKKQSGPELQQPAENVKK